MRRKQENADIRRSPGKRRASSALISLSLAVTLGATAIGCSGEDTSDQAASPQASGGLEHDAAEDALIKAYLEDQGYDTSTLRFEGEAAVVEDDMLMSRSVLLQEAEAAAAGVVEKGYFITGPLFAGKRVQLSFESAVSNLWRTALNSARDKWNAAIPLSRDPGGAGTITVQVRALTDNNGNALTNVIAQGSIPSFGRIIQLNSNFINRSAECGGTNANPVTIETLSASRKLYQALHEMGHVLGFAHPPPIASNATREHISGTAVSTASSGDPSYSTVMAQGCKTLTSLTADDGLSARKKYPGCIDTCERNCTFGDPAQIGLCQFACPSQCGA